MENPTRLKFDHLTVSKETGIEMVTDENMLIINQVTFIFCLYSSQ